MIKLKDELLDIAQELLDEIDGAEDGNRHLDGVLSRAARRLKKLANVQAQQPINSPTPTALRNVLDRLLLNTNGQENETTFALRVTINVMTPGGLEEALIDVGIENNLIHHLAEAIRRALCAPKVE